MPLKNVTFPKEKLTLLNFTLKNVTPAWEIPAALKGCLLLLWSFVPKTYNFCTQLDPLTHQIVKCFVLFTLETGGPSEGSSCELTKSSKSAAGVGARDIFAFVSRIDLFRKIAQMLHWLEFRDTHGLFSTVPFSDHAGRGMQTTQGKCIKASFRLLFRSS